MPPNKHMQRAGKHKVLGRGHLSLVPCSAHRARVLKGQRAGADVNRWATSLLAFKAHVTSVTLTLEATVCNAVDNPRTT
jgi:hypothetical protein